MRRYIGVLGALGLFGCGSEHGPEGTLVKPGPGVLGVPGAGHGVNASRALPVSGGTLLVSGHTAVAADPDRDRVFIAHLETANVREVVLQPGDEPGRVAEDGAGRVHVAARAAGVVISIDLAAATIVDRRAVCPAPRGIAHDPATGLLHVACQTGELVSLPAAGGESVRTLELGRDLRDVLIRGTRLLVSRFKTAELLVVDEAGRVTSTPQPAPSSDSFGVNPRTPSIAWRMIALPDGKVGMIHQRGNVGTISVGPSGYGAGGGMEGCAGAIVEGTLSRFGVPELQADPMFPEPASPALGAMVGPSDVAVSPNGQIAVISIGHSWFADAAPLMPNGMPAHDRPPPPRRPKIAIIPPGAGPDPCATPDEDAEIEGEPVSVAYFGERIVVQSREPAQLQVLGQEGFKIPLSADSRADTGLALFHMDSGLGIACASCHPEGMEDGRVWIFADFGARRTQNIGGGIIDTAPFHWAGDLADFPALIHEVFESRMGSVRPNRQQVAAFATWVETLPAPTPAVVDASAVERGRALFESAQTGCSTCHAGARLTTNETHDVGTGGPFQVPSLVGVGSRPPYMHNGCAPTLHDRFGNATCGGGDLHGTTSTLGPAQIDDMVAYLESL